MQQDIDTTPRARVLPDGLIAAVTLPWPPKTLSPNARPHFMALSKAKKAYRKACCEEAWAAGVRPNVAYKPPLHVRVEFIPPDRRSRDKDNLIAAMKAGFDGLADALGIDDKHFRLDFLPVSPEIGGMVKVQISEAA